MSEKIYRVQMNSKGMPNFATAVEVYPSADRPRGENLLEEYPSLFECSVCGASCNDTIPWDCNINYCPNCGAKMREREGE